MNAEDIHLCWRFNELVAYFFRNVVALTRSVCKKNYNTKVNNHHIIICRFLGIISSHRLIYLAHLFCRHEASCCFVEMKTRVWLLQKTSRAMLLHFYWFMHKKMLWLTTGKVIYSTNKLNQVATSSMRWCMIRRK